MSVTCYNPLPEDIRQISKAILGSDDYLIDKSEIRHFIFKYCDYKGYRDYSEYKNNINDFYDFIRDYLGISDRLEGSLIKDVNNLLSRIPKMSGEIPGSLIEDSIKTLNLLIEDKNSKFKYIKLQNGNYKIVFPPDVYTKEMLDIKNKAIADGTFKKVFNKKLNEWVDSNLDERQWLHVRTKAFKEWFGDWENDPANASKVVDENKEPLVVYHGTMEPGFNIFEQQIWQPRKGFYFTEKNVNAKAYGEIYSCFLNIKNPKIYDFKGNNWNNPPYNGIKSTDDAVNKTPENKYDGTIIYNVVDSGGSFVGVGNDYIAFNSNQIKSATYNIGTYYKENDDIRYNKDLNEDLNLLQYLSTSFKKRGYNSLDDTSSVIHKVINKFHGRYYLSQVNPQEAKDNLEFEREKLRLPKGIFSYNKRGNGVEVTLNSDLLQDFIEESKELNIIQKSFDKEISGEVLDILSFLSAKTGMKYKMINKTEASELLKTDLSKIRKVNAFVKNGTCYFIKGRKLNADIAAEEMLHPMVHAIKQTSPELYKNLLNESKELFPKLHTTILQAYKDSSLEEKNEELVTQALARAFRVERQNNPRGRKLIEFIQHFIESILEFFMGDIGGLFSKDFITLNEIKSNTSIVDFVKIINSNIQIEFGEEYKNIQMFNKEDNEINAMLAFIKAVNFKKESKGFEDFNNFKTKVQNIVKPHEDFKNNHIYLIDGIPAQTSVTKFIEDPNYENPKKEIFNSESNKFKSAALAIGDSIDAVVREFFENGDKINKNNKNLPKHVLNSLETQLLGLRKQLDNYFGFVKYKVIAQEINIPGNVTYKDKKGNTKTKSIVGTPDLIVVSETGEYFIVDIKTVNATNIPKDSLNNYKKQVNLYKELMHAYTKDTSLTHRGNYILQINVQYEDTQEYALNKNNEYESAEGEKLKDNFNNVDTPISIKKHKDSSIGYFLDANGEIINETNAIIDAYNISNLSKEDIKEISEVSEIAEEEIKEVQKNAKQIIDKHKKEVDRANSMDTVNLQSNVLSASEISKIGKTLVKLFCYHINILSKDPVKLQKLLKTDLPITEGMPADVIIRQFYKDLKAPLLKYLSKKFFNIDSLNFDSPEFLKMNYIKNNINTIFNRNFAEFQDIEKVSVKYNISENVENQYDENLLDSLEEDGREPYYIDSKEVSFIESMPARIKREFSLIPKCEVDLKGNIIYANGYPQIKLNSEGMPEFYEKNEIIIEVLENVHHLRSIEEMMSFLEKSTEDYFQFIYKKLENDRQLQTIFYRTFRKNKTVYYNSKSLRKAKFSFLGDLLTKNYYMDAVHSYVNGLLTGVKYNNNIFKKEGNNIIVDVKKINSLQKELQEKPTILTVKKHLKQLQLPKFKIKLKDVTAAKEALSGFYRNVLSNTVENTDIIQSKNITDSCYGRLINTLLPYAEKHYEMTAYDNGKTYAIYTEPTFIQDVIEDIQYGRFQNLPQGNPNNWQFSRNVDGSPVFVNSWYNDYKNDSKIKQIRHCKKTTTNDNTYQDLNSHQYLLSIIQDYFCAFHEDFFVQDLNESEKKKLRLFRVPTMSDKPTMESILFFATSIIKSNKPKNNYNLQEMKEGIANKVFEYFIMELSRMRHLINNYSEDNTGIAVYDIPNTINANLKSKITEGQKKQKYNFTIDDFIDSSTNTWKKELNKSGMRFSFISEFNTIFDNNDEHTEIIKQAIVDYINNGELGYSKNTGNLENAFKNKFIEIMDSQYSQFKENYFNPANKSSEYSKTEFINGNPEKVTRDFYTDIIPGEKQELKDAYLQEFFYNDYLATLNILNMTIVDPAFFKDTIDLQKRFAQVHSSTIKPDKDAVFRTQNGAYKKYSDGIHRFIIIEDVIKPSQLKKQVEELFKNKAEQAKTEEEHQMYLKLKNTVPALFDNVTTTDGQAFSSPTGAWKKRGMLGEDSASEFKYVLDEIRKGNYGALINYTNTMSQTIKSFTSSIVQDVNNSSTYKPIQLKDSEAMLLAVEIFKNEDLKTPLNAIYDFLENSHYNFVKNSEGKPIHNDETYYDKGIDLVVFKSAVKEGSQKVLSLEGKSYEQVYDELLNYVKTDTVHKNPFDHWGQQQNTPQHFYNSTVDLGSQIRILPVADLPEDFSIDVETDKGFISMNKSEFLSYYFTLIAEDFNAGIGKVINDLGLNGDLSNKAHSLKTMVIDSIMKDSKQTLVTLDAVDKHNKDNTIIGDPDIATKVYSTIFSKIKKAVNKQNFLGGSTIQASDIATNKQLHVRDYLGKTPNDKGFDISKGKVAMDIMVAAYDDVFYNKITYDKSKEKAFKSLNRNYSYKKGDIMKVEDLLELNILTKEDLKMIGYRIPTEDKYSSFCFNIVGFLPIASGEQIMVPYEAIGLSGFDFDIKQNWCH